MVCNNCGKECELANIELCVECNKLNYDELEMI